MVFKKYPSQWNVMLTVVVVAITAFMVIRLASRPDFHWLSLLPSLLACLSLPKLLYDSFYLPRVGRLIVDDQGIHLNARRFSWSYSWQDLECAYYNKGAFKLRQLHLYSASKSEKIISDLSEWQAETGEPLLLHDAVEHYLPVKPYIEIPRNQGLMAADLGPGAKKATFVIGATLLALFVASFFIHRYYVLSGGTPTVLWVLGGLFALVATLMYLYNSYAHAASYPGICLLGFIMGAFSVPLMIKSYVILFYEVETHEFQLVEKNGGYQHWRSLQDARLDIELGSVNNRIHTENERGALLKLQLLDSQLVTLLLPGELEKTRYLVKP